MIAQRSHEWRTVSVTMAVLAVPFLLLLLVTGCTMPAGMNVTCDWPAGSAEPRDDTERRHLAADVRIAEELAMRFADAGADSPRAHSDRRSACEAKLFGAIARSRGVSLAAIAQAREELDRNTWDAAVHVPLIALYIGTAVLLARRIACRFPRDEKIAAVLSTLFVSVVFGVVFVILGHLWDGVVEMIRLGNTHMSYRTQRLGWREYSEEAFAGAVVLFWAVVLVSYRFLRVSPHPSASIRV